MALSAVSTVAGRTYQEIFESWLTFLIFLFLFFLYICLYNPQHLQRLLNLQQCRRNTLYFFQTSQFHPHTHGSLGAFISLWTISATVADLLMPQIQFLTHFSFFQMNAFLSVSSSPRQSVISSKSHINIYNAGWSANFTIFMPVNFCRVLWKTSNKKW